MYHRFGALFGLLISVVALVGCPSPGPDEDETEASPGKLVLAGVSEADFNSVNSEVYFNLEGATLSEEDGHVVGYLNGEPISDTLIGTTESQIILANALVDGKNQIEIYTDDSEGRSLWASVELWAGSNSLWVSTVDEAGNPKDALIEATVAEAPKLKVLVPSTGGMAEIKHVPYHTILVSGSADDGALWGAAGGMGGSGIELRLYSMAPESPIDNNAFQLGTTDGWNIGDAPVTIVEHQEPTDGVTTKAQNFDLQLGTSGEGPRHISRTFKTKPGTSSVTVRYRFITSEVPGGYFGSQYNDYFSVSIRSSTGEQVAESNSMNGLGLAAFDASGATTFRETTLPVKTGGGKVQVDITVANVADGLFDSQVVVDMVAERDLAITAADLRDIDNTPLRFLSAAPHPYFGGNTRINGTLTIKGDEDTTVTSVELEILRGGVLTTVGTLAPAAQAALLQKLGADQKVQVASPQLLFEIPSPSLAALDTGLNGDAALRLRVRSDKGDDLTRDLGTVTVLDLYEGTVRYGDRDAAVGGDDWLIPSVADVLIDSGISVGDISNMNAGPFPQHATHRQGIDVDGWFDSYNNRDAATAQTMIDHLNAAYGPRIRTVYVTFQQQAGDPFWDAIDDVVLADGRRARDVIRPIGGHTTHFHWRIAP